MSPLILDNIGIVTNGGQVFEDYAVSIGKAAEDLTDAEKKQALLNLAIKDGNELVDAQSTGFERLDVAVQDTTDSLKKAVGEALDPVASALANIINLTLDLHQITGSLGLTYVDFVGYVNSAGEVVARNEEELVEWYNTLGNLNERTHELSWLFRDFPVLEPEVNTAPAESTLQTFDEWLADWSKQAKKNLQLALEAQWQAELYEIPAEPGLAQQHGGTFTVPPGYPNDSFRARFSSGERVSVQNDERSFFGNSTVNINNGTGMEAFEELLRSIQ